jgi:hypothetical protein
MEIPAKGGRIWRAAHDTVLLYGHLDKQPEMTGWREGLGPWSPVREGRQALRPRRRRRRLRGLRLADGDRALRARAAPRALRGAHRGLRGERQLRPAGVHRPPRARIGTPSPRRVPRLGLRQLRPAVVHHLAARPRRRRRCGRHAARRRALGRRERHRAVELPHRSPAARRGSRTARRAHPASRRSTSEIPEAARGAGRGRRGGARRGRVGALPVGRRHASSDGRRTFAERILNRTWRPTLSVTGADGPAADRQGRQRAAARSPR